MADPDPFRTLLAIGALTIFPVMLYHRLKARTPGERLDRRQEGWFILLTLRPIGLMTLIALFSYLISPRTLAWAEAPFPVWLRWTGIVLCAFGEMLLVWTVRTLGPNLTDTVVTRRQHTLVTRGPYQWVRHPFYGSIAMFACGSALAAANWFLLAGGATVYTLLVIRTAAEEERLVARFGDAYRAYMRRTGRFVPSLRVSHSRG